MPTDLFGNTAPDRRRKALLKRASTQRHQRSRQTKRLIAAFTKSNNDFYKPTGSRALRFVIRSDVLIDRKSPSEMKEPTPS